MGRMENIITTYAIVEGYSKQVKQPISPLDLTKYTMQKTGVRKETAMDYIDALKRGVHIRGKYLKITYQGKGFLPWKG